MSRLSFCNRPSTLARKNHALRESTSSLRARKTSRLLFPSFRFFIFLSCYIDSLGDVFIDALTIKFLPELSGIIVGAALAIRLRARPERLTVAPENPNG